MAFTYFFRDLQTLELIADHLIPFVSGRSRIRIWDAGCAMGQEAYTLAIILAERMGRFAFKNVQILATDIDGSDLFEDIIKNGVYPNEEIQRIPADLLEKYFQPAEKPGHSQLIDLIRQRVTYQKHDLLSLRSIGEEFCLVLCKNVLLHFQPQERTEVIRMYHQSLTPGGFFATEQTQKLPDGVSSLFEPVVSNAQLFKKV